MMTFIAMKFIAACKERCTKIKFLEFLILMGFINENGIKDAMKQTKFEIENIFVFILKQNLKVKHEWVFLGMSMHPLRVFVISSI